MPVVVYESTLDAPEFFGSEVMHGLEAFKAGCVVVVTNCWCDGIVLFLSQIGNHIAEHGQRPGI